MAIVHRTTLVPGKLELLTDWMVMQDWYAGQARAPQLTKAGGFRLDDPDGEVGIEFMLVLDGAGDDAAVYQVPMTYRGRALAGAETGLIGTTEHGVLGGRWVYDGTRDPVLLAQAAELVRGRAQAQAQSQSDTPDLAVLSRPLTQDSDGPLELDFARALSPIRDDATPEPGQVTALWTAADGTQARGVLISARPASDA